jgi:hypothetical protein
MHHILYYTHTHIYIYIHTHTHTHTYVYTYICIYIYIYVYMCVYIYVCVYIYYIVGTKVQILTSSYRARILVLAEAKERLCVLKHVSICTFVLVKQVNWVPVGPQTRQYLYFCTSKASKLSTCGSSNTFTFLFVLLICWKTYIHRERVWRLYVCMYIRTYVCMYVCIYVCIYIYLIYVHINTYM